MCVIYYLKNVKWRRTAPHMCNMLNFYSRLPSTRANPTKTDN